MEEFEEEDDYSDLYADVEVQASSAIMAMNGLTGMLPANAGVIGGAADGCRRLPPEDGGVLENAAGGAGKDEDNGFSEVEIAVGKMGSYGDDTGLEEGEIEGDDVNKNGDDLNTVLSDGCGGKKQKLVDNRDNCENGVEEEKDKMGEGINANKKHLNSGGFSSQRKHELVEGSSNSKKKTFNRKTSQVHEPRETDDADLDKGGGVCFSSDSEGEMLSLENDDERRGKIACGRGSRHRTVCYPMSLDKYGTVQISDSDEVNHHELSGCGSDGMDEVMENSDDTDRRNASSMSDKVPSAVEPESSQSDWDQHGQRFSCRHRPHPRAAASSVDTVKRHKNSRRPSASSDPKSWKLTSRDCHTSKDSKTRGVKPDGRYYEIDKGTKGKSNNHLKKPSVRLDPQLEEFVACDYHRSKESKSHRVKPTTRDGRYCQRDRGPIRKDLNLKRRSNHVSNLKTHEDAYDGIGIKDHYDMHKSSTGHEKRGARLSSIDKDMLYSDGFLNYFGGIHRNDRSASTSLQNRYWKIHQDIGYEAGWCDAYSRHEKQSFLKKKRDKVDYEYLAGDWHREKRRHMDHDVNPLDFEESRKLIQKYPSVAVNGGGTEFRERGDGLRFKSRAKGHDLPPLQEYDSDFIEGKDKRYMLASGRNRDQRDHRYYQNIPQDRSDIKGTGRDKMKYDCPFNSFDYAWCMENEDNDRRYIEGRPLPFHYKGPRVPRRAQVQQPAVPKYDVPGGPVRSERCSWKERDEESDRCGNNNTSYDTREGRLEYCHAEDHIARGRHDQQSSVIFNTTGSSRNHHHHDRFIRSRDHQQQPEIFHLCEEDYKCMQRNDTMYSAEGPSYCFEGISRRRPDRRHSTDYVAEVPTEREVDGCRYKLVGERNCGNQFDQRSCFYHRDQPVRMHPRYQDSYLALEGDKCCTKLPSRRTVEVGEDAVRYGMYELMEWNDDCEPENFKELNDFNQDQAVAADGQKVDTNQSDKQSFNKFSPNQHAEFLDAEEGQIIDEEISEGTLKCEIESKRVTKVNDVEHTETTSNGDRVVGLDDQKIQEIMVKMERRRERFKDPITLNPDHGKTSKNLPDIDVEADEGNKILRPVRKRRWLGS